MRGRGNQAVKKRVLAKIFFPDCNLIEFLKWEATQIFPEQFKPFF